MASSHTSLEENLSCSICLEIFKDPVVLGCSHSFCKACLDSSWTRKEVKKCPLCGKTSRSTPLHSLSLKNTCESLIEEKRRRVSAEPQGVVCMAHAENHQLFCVDDQKLVCMQCVAHDHKDHNFCSISKVASDHKTQLQRPLQKLQANLKTLTSAQTSYSRISKEQLQSQVQQTEKQIKEKFEKLHLFLTEEEKNRIAALKEEKKKKEEEMNERIDEITKLCSDLSERIQKIQSDMTLDDCVFLQNFRDIEERTKYTAPNLNLNSFPLIDVAKHLGNLKYRVWEKMKDICPYYPVILNPATKKLNHKLSEDLSSVTFEQGVTPNSTENTFPLVLGSEGFTTGTWEVEVGHSQQWAVGVIKESDKETRQALKNSVVIYLLKGKQSWRTTAPKFVKVRVIVDSEKVMFTDPDTNTTLQTHPHVSNEKVYPCFCTLSQVPLKILPAKVSVSV